MLVDGSTRFGLGTRIHTPQKFILDDFLVHLKNWMDFSATCFFWAFFVLEECVC